MGPFGRSAVHQQHAIRAKNRQDVTARACDLEERIGKLVNFQRCSRCRAMGQRYTSRARNEISQESSTVR